MSNILLIDVDSKIPNLALMKISTYWKSRGAKVGFVSLGLSGYPKSHRKIRRINASKFDKYYLSCIFTCNKNLYVVDGIGESGGTGVDFLSHLPKEIDNLDEDYSLYPNNKISYGFITRGCIRNCPFCFVPKKEGDLQFYRSWRSIAKHKVVHFLDNNFLAWEGHAECLREMNNEGLKFQFNQGLDIRLLDSQNSKLLADSRYDGEYIFAFDHVKLENLITSKLQLFRNYTNRKEWGIKFFIYHNDETMKIEDTIYRVLWCRKQKVLPYIMRDKNCWNSENEEFYTDLAAWCNQPKMFKSLSFVEFCNFRHQKNKKRAESSSNTYLLAKNL